MILETKWNTLMNKYTCCKFYSRWFEFDVIYYFLWVLYIYIEREREREREKESVIEIFIVSSLNIHKFDKNNEYFNRVPHIN